MPKPPSLRSQEVIAALKKDGWHEQRQRGSHLHLKKEGAAGRVTVPVHSKPLTPGTLRNIIKQAGLTVEEFLELL